MFSASLLVLSVSLNNAGFKSIIDAWSASIVANIENKPNKEVELKLQQLDNRLKAVETLAHHSGEK